MKSVYLFISVLILSIFNIGVCFSQTGIFELEEPSTANARLYGIGEFSSMPSSNDYSPFGNSNPILKSKPGHGTGGNGQGGATGGDAPVPIQDGIFTFFALSLLYFILKTYSFKKVLKIKRDDYLLRN